MIPPRQPEALAVPTGVVDLSFDIRLGQSFAQLGLLGSDQTGRSLGNIDEEQLQAVLCHHRAELAARQANAPKQAPKPTGAAVTPSQGATLSRTAPAAEL